MYVCPITQRDLRGWRSPAGVTFPMWEGIPILVPEPDALIATAGEGGPPTELLSPFLPPAMLGAPGRLGSWLVSELRTPAAVAAALGSRLAPPGPALDAGCGLAAVALSMANRGRPTWAIDTDPHILVCARDILLGRVREARLPGGPVMPLPLVPLRPSQVQLAVADVRAPPFRDGAFAWVHLGAPEGLAAAVRLLSPGGVLTCVTTDGLDDDRLNIVDEEEVVVVRPEGPRRFAVAVARCVAARKGPGG